ncbi:thrombospondin type 3 repeat-containing protein [Thalassotalea psychrophila]|uniref:Thrombospondin type 3 repeat-containing protein n=1 Tax=Thalassotalea psychrophila TaxID=3065647 RepID=A0ABY9TVT4_9GAMM|nr:thrombospondin type 3 repeat-containing protein [Colwelliaceae bacterium SQ149]
MSKNSLLKHILLCSLIFFVTACGGSGGSDSTELKVQQLDTDNDGISDDADTDIDGDGTLNTEDAFPLDASESVDMDGDGIGNNADTDIDGDGTLNTEDAFPLDASESVDIDGDGVGNNADTDIDGDGTLNTKDAFPLDASESVDIDGDGIGNNADTDIDGDGTLNTEDAFPLDASESVDIDGDGIGNNTDTDIDGDGTLNTEDAFPLDASESVDMDGDGIGNNADTDIDGDGTLNTEDAFPLDVTIIFEDKELGVGSSVELILYQPHYEISNIKWRQTSGTPVEFFSSNTKVIAFTIPDNDDYGFAVSYYADGKLVEESFTFSNKQYMKSNKLVARLGHSVIEGGDVSLRAWLTADINTESVTWQQLSGPEVVFNTDNINQLIAIFTVPEVIVDSIIELEVSAKDINNNLFTDTVSLLVENASSNNSEAYFSGDILAKIHPYNANSAYKDSLVDCVYSSKLTSSCQLGILPLIAGETNGETPTIEQIMDRVVVSHDWMGQRFREYLEGFDEFDDFKNLLRATTAIVISYDIRPSFYWAATGAIYLDPNNLWLTPDERDTINEAPDYRAGFGSELQFVMPWRYVKNNDYVNYYFPLDQRLTRQLSHVKYDLANLLYHELAHANDFFPPAEWGAYDDNVRFLDAALTKAEISDGLTTLYPLQSQEMKDLAAVRFMGESVSAIQKSYLPADVANFYKDDIANGFYNYTTDREDLSILFEELMMSIRYGVQRDTAVTSGSDTGYIVTWGQRGRVGKQGIKERASYVAGHLMPELNSSLIDVLPNPKLMTSGLDWWDNLSISTDIPTPLLSPKTGDLHRNMEASTFKHENHIRKLPLH